MKSRDGQVVVVSWNIAGDATGGNGAGAKHPRIPPSHQQSPVPHCWGCHMRPLGTATQRMRSNIRSVPVAGRR